MESRQERHPNRGSIALSGGRTAPQSVSATGGHPSLRPNGPRAAAVSPGSAAVVILVLCALVPQGVRAAWETYTDRPGSDIKSFLINKDVEAFVAVKQCEDACKNNAQCKAFTYVAPGIQGPDGRCYLKNAVPAPVTNKCCTSGVVRPVTKADYCNNYALEAQLASTNNLNYQCGYTGNRWSSDKTAHYNWCMSVPQAAASNEAAERARLLAECTKPTSSGDLAAQGVCYDLSIYGADMAGGTITFHPIIKDAAGSGWRSHKKGRIFNAHTLGSVLTEGWHDLPAYPYWELASNATAEAPGAIASYQPNLQYTYTWRLTHDEDTNPANNKVTKGFDTFSGYLTGSMLASHPWLLANKACTKVPIKHWPLNLYWSQVDSNGIPLNPSWGWQLEHAYGSADYYPDVAWLTPLLQVRHFKVLGYSVKKLGEERDFAKATNQKLFKEYGGNYIPKINMPVPGVCGPHVNWTIPVTYEGILKTEAYDGDDGDFNFYIFTPKGYGAVKKGGNHGGIKIEFDSKETVDHFHTPWWSKFALWTNTVPFVKVDKSATTDNKYAIVTGLWGMDCAHECDSEIHPAWAIAIRAKEKDPNDDMWAIFVRNWGNEGFCSDHVFPVYYPKQGNQYIYKFLLPWRPGAASVTVRQDTQFLQKGGVGLGVKPVPNKGVLVTFSLPDPSQRPRINGELHLKWTYPAGVSPKPYPLPEAAVANGARATGKVALEDTLMNQRIMQVLPPSERQLYENVLRTANAKPRQIPFDTNRPLSLARGAERVTAAELPKITVVPDAVKLNEKREVLQRLRIDPEVQQMELMIENVRPLQRLQR